MAKRIIFSTMQQGDNCHEACGQNGNCSCNYDTLCDEQMNLNVKVDGRILGIADIGRWNGRFTGCKIFSNTVSSILETSSDYVEIYGDGKNIKATQVHHDGRNHIEYRIIREDRNIQVLIDKITNQQEVTRQMINYYTKSLYPSVAKVYGWR